MLLFQTGAARMCRVSSFLCGCSDLGRGSVVVGVYRLVVALLTLILSAIGFLYIKDFCREFGCILAISKYKIIPSRTNK